MRTLIRIAIVGFALFSHCLAYAGGHVGNGGDAIVCYSSPNRKQIVSIELFDFWEGENSHGSPGQIELGDPSLSVSEKIEIAVNRVGAFDPVLADRLGRTAQALASHIDTYLVTGEELPEIDDTHPRALPSAPCFIEQFAVQWKDVASGKRRFAISRKFYESPLISNDSRAGILLHEAIYRQAILSGHTDSDGTRYFNYRIATADLDGAPLKRYTQVLVDSGLGAKGCQLHEISQIGVSLFGKYEDDYRGVRTYRPCLPFTVELPTFKLRGLEGALIAGPANAADSDMMWGFHAERSEISMRTASGWVTKVATWTKASITQAGKLHRLGTSWYDHSNGDLPIQIQLPDGQTLPCIDNPGFVVFFNSKGEIRMCILRDRVTPFSFQGRTLKLGSFDYLTEFDEQYRLRQAQLTEPASFTVAGTKVKLLFKDRAFLKLDEHGKVVHGKLVTPYSLMVNGVKTEIDSIHVEDKTLGTVFVWARHHLAPTFQGKRILYTDIYSEAWERLCMRLGYTRQPRGYPEKSETVFVAGPEQLYDPESGTFVTRIDEEVSVVSQGLRCEGYFDVPLR